MNTFPIENIKILMDLYNSNKIEIVESEIKNYLKTYPNELPLHIMLGAVFSKQRKYTEAIKCYRDALTINPNHANIYNNLGIIFKNQGNYVDSEKNYKKAIILNSNFSEAYYNLAILYKKQLKFDKAVEYYNKAILIKPKYVEAYNNLGNILQDQGEAEEAIKKFKKAISIKPDYIEAYNNIAHTSLVLNETEESNIFEYHLLFNSLIKNKKIIARKEHKNNKDPKKILRVGYISGNFNTHSVSFFFEPVIKNHNPKMIETFCYYNHYYEDDFTKRLMKYSDNWRNIFDMNDEDVSRSILQDKIDILVDLSGHSIGNRLLIFAYKPAPIQVTWLGYNNTTGIKDMDYRLVDYYTDPKDKFDKYNSEQLWRLPNNLAVYQPPYESPSVQESPCVKNKYLTFGSFNNQHKHTLSTIELWSKILNKIPDSRIILKNKYLQGDFGESFKDKFLKLGVSKNRITVYGKDNSIKEHLKHYNEIDIALDPFPYNGVTTTMEALWMGVPVISLKGNRSCSRMSHSINLNLGFDNLSGNNKKDYVEIAIKLAKDPSKLISIRKNLRNKLSDSSLLNAETFVDNLEEAFRDMWVKWCSRN